MHLALDPRLHGVGRRIVVATHRRSGTHLAIDLLRRQFAECRARKRLGEGLDSLYLNLDRLLPHPEPLCEARAAALLRRAERPIVKTHALGEHLDGKGPHAAFVASVLADAQLVVVVRDGRDVLASLHAYVRGYDPTAPAGLSDFLRQEVAGESRAAHWARCVTEQLAVPQVRAVRFEDLLEAPGESLERLADWLRLEPCYAEPILPKPLRSAWQSRAGRLLAREPRGTTIPGARPARWCETWSPEDRAFFHAEAGELLIELGYEEDAGWVGAAA